MSVQDVIRVESAAIAKTFTEWLSKNMKTDLKAIFLEGLPHAGKSTLLRSLSAKHFLTIELDNYIRPPAPSTAQWKDCVQVQDVRDLLRNATLDDRVVVLDGPAVWLLAEQILGPFDRSQVLRVYLKQMSCTGEYVDWLSELFFNDSHLDDRPFFRSIWDHHATKPWELADLILERLPEGDDQKP